MNVASLELSKELYELSGWKDTSFSWASVIDKTVAYKPLVRATIGSNSAWHEDPAYDLGYMLRKLPHRTQKNGQFNLSPYLDYKPHPFPNLPTTMVMWQAQYGPEAHRQLGDTPEDAACRLAIELFKQGVLTRNA